MDDCRGEPGRLFDARQAASFVSGRENLAGDVAGRSIRNVVREITSQHFGAPVGCSVALSYLLIALLVAPRIEFSTFARDRPSLLAQARSLIGQLLLTMPQIGFHALQIKRVISRSSL